MKLYLTGVLEEGGPRRAGVPINPRTTLNIPQGVDLELHFRVQRTDGSFVQFLTGSSVTWTVKKRPQDNPPPVSKTVAFPTADGGVEVVFTLAPVDTKNMSPGRYVYDIWLTQPPVGLAAGKRDDVLPLSPLVLEAAATPAP